MDPDFFHRKRPWSRYKDAILEYYLTPYIPKVARLNRPIMLVDCFAGPGKFDDGSDGSPMIIANAVKSWRDRGIDVSAMFIEEAPMLFNLLAGNLRGFEGVNPIQGRFEEQLATLASLSRSHTMFLYVDPYSVAALNLDQMRTVFQRITSHASSVELLMNFNAAIFGRWAIAALKRHPTPSQNQQMSEIDDEVDEKVEPPEIETLDQIAGGDYWRELFSNDAASFREILTQFLASYRKQLRQSFSCVCSYEVKKRYQHEVPKYALVFGTRSWDGAELMNDSMNKAHRAFIHQEFVKDRLIDSTPQNEMVDIPEVERSILHLLSTRAKISRKEIRRQLLPMWFCRMTTGELNKVIQELLKTGAIISSSGRTRINDDVLLQIRATS